MRQLVQWGLILGTCLGGFNCGELFSARAAQVSAPRYNVLLITPDQMRADYMHTYGYSLPDTPNIDQLAREGTVFLRAYSDGAWTTPSFGSILTGLYPTVHGMTLPPPESCGAEIARPMATGKSSLIPSFLALSTKKPTIPEILKTHEMVTAADVANCWAAWDVRTRGWDSLKFFSGSQAPNPKHPDLRNTIYLTGPQTLEWAQQWLREHRDRRFFFWVHFMEPHSPYNAPRDYDYFRTADDYPDLYDDNRNDSTILHGLAKTGDVHAIRRLQQLYAAKILYADHYIGELIKTVDGLGLDKNTIIILVSDHGQLLYSHPNDFNTDDHRSVYDADLHVPLIIRGPGLPGNQRVNSIVGQSDLVPTILDLENLPDKMRFDGKSLKPIVTGDATQVHQYTYSEISVDNMPQYAIRDQRYKLIETISNGKLQCFDTLTDPGELHNICSETFVKAAELKTALDEHIQDMTHQAKSYPDWRNNLA